ncbi:Pyruvate carboxylase [Bacillus velezensis]|nr:Pyruvate carboxylase [Bacillus velezensis]
MHRIEHQNGSRLFKEDSGSYHRYKADEAYLVGEGKKPIDAYLDIEGIIEIAKETA